MTCLTARFTNLDTPRDFPGELEDLEAWYDSIGAQPEEPPPFDVGDRVYVHHHPGRGSLKVTHVTPDPPGWRVTAGEGNYATDCPASSFRRCQPGWSEPPAIPFGSMPDGASPEAWERKRIADLDDPDHGRAISQWRESMQAWLAGLPA